MLGTNDHAMRAKNNPFINENPSNPLIELIQLCINLDHSQNEEWQTVKSINN